MVAPVPSSASSISAITVSTPRKLHMASILTTSTASITERHDSRLISNTITTRTSTQEQQPKKTPRPPNSFILYRKENAVNYPKFTAAELSRILGERWSKETPERKAHYARLAKIAEHEHSLKYPEYKFCPAKRGTGKKAKALKAAAKAGLSTDANHAMRITAPYSSQPSINWTTPSSSTSHQYVSSMSTAYPLTATKSNIHDASSWGWQPSHTAPPVQGHRQRRRVERPSPRFSNRAISNSPYILTSTPSMHTAFRPRLPCSQHPRIPFMTESAPASSGPIASSLFFDSYVSAQWQWQLDSQYSQARSSLPPVATCAPETSTSLVYFGLARDHIYKRGGNDTTRRLQQEIDSTSNTQQHCMESPRHRQLPSTMGEPMCNMPQTMFHSHSTWISPGAPSSPMPFALSSISPETTVAQFSQGLEVQSTSVMTTSAPLLISTMNENGIPEARVFPTSVPFTHPEFLPDTSSNLSFPSHGYPAPLPVDIIPFQIPPIMEHDMVISPVLSACSSLSSLSSCLQDQHAFFTNTGHQYDMSMMGHSNHPGRSPSSIEA